jgi:hypothetical protein
MLFAIFDIYPDFHSFFNYRDIVILYNVSIKLRAKMKIIITMLKAKFYNCDYCNFSEVNPLLVYD